MASRVAHALACTSARAAAVRVGALARRAHLDAVANRGRRGDVCGVRMPDRGAATARLMCTSPTTEAAKDPETEEPSLDSLLPALDIRAGRILSIERHPEADSLYIEQIDVGEEEPRTVVSGLVPYLAQSELENQCVVVLCNLKPRNMRGVKSHGMLLCASAKDDGKVELLKPDPATPAGERLCFGTFDEDAPEPFKPNKVQKKKVWEKVQPGLRTTDERAAAWNGLPLLSSLGQVKADSLADSAIS